MSGALAWTWADVGFDPALVADAGRGLCLVVIGRERAEAQLARFAERHGLEVVALTAGAPAADWPERRARLDDAAAQLKRYGAGQLRQFDLTLDLRGTAFERAVWDALLEIPFGATQTYGALAEAIDRAGGARAVGNAAGRNPVPIVVPCHRLLASGGLGGFSGGAERKRALLGIEGHPLEIQRDFL